MKKMILGIVISLLLTPMVFAESYSNVSTVKGLTIGPSHVRVQLDSMVAAEGCSVTRLYFLDTSTSKDIYSALLAAKTSQQLVSLQLIGCQNNMAKISHLYLCDSGFCS